MGADQNNRMFKTGIAHPRHCNQNMSTKVHRATRAKHHITNMRNRVGGLKA